MSDQHTGEQCYFQRLGPNEYVPTQLAQGAWSDKEIHFSPLSGILANAVLEHQGASAAAGLLLSRISFDILGFLPLAPCTIEVATIRPGRTITLVEATATIEGRSVAVARAWFTVASDTSAVAGGGEAPLPPVDTATSWDGGGWNGGFVKSVDVRVVHDGGPGERAVWVSTDIPLLADGSAHPVAQWLTCIDIANGVAARVQPGAWMFPNVDLGIHLHRQPAGRLTGLFTSVAYGATGQGITASMLYDESGHVGWAQQALTIRAMPSST